MTNISVFSVWSVVEKQYHGIHRTHRISKKMPLVEDQLYLCRITTQ